MNPEEKELWRQKFLEVLKGFRLLDDNFMTAAFQGSLECIDLVLQIVLRKPEVKATKAVTQDTLKNLHGRSVRLDIHAFADDKEINVEIQRGGKGAGEQRARYHGSIMDANVLLPGEDYENLPESYVIFITETDVLGDGLPIYTIERIIKENGKSFHDGSHIIYVNSSITDENTSLGRLMHDFRCTKADDMYYPVLAERVRYLKENEEGVATMCEAMEKLTKEARAYGVAQGIEQGIEQGKVDIVLGMLRDKLPLETISRISKFSLERVQELGKMNQLL